MIGSFFGVKAPSPDQCAAPSLLSPLAVCLARVKTAADPISRQLLARFALSTVTYDERYVPTKKNVYDWTPQDLEDLLKLVAVNDRDDRKKLDETPMDSVQRIIKRAWTEMANEPSQGAEPAAQALDLITLDPRAEILRCFLSNRTLIPHQLDDDVHHPLHSALSDDTCLTAALATAQKLLLSLRATAYLVLIFCSMRRPFLAHEYVRMQGLEASWLAYTLTQPEKPRFHANQLMFSELKRLFFRHSYGGKGSGLFSGGFSSFGGDD